MNAYAIPADGGEPIRARFWHQRPVTSFPSTLLLNSLSGTNPCIDQGVFGPQNAYSSYWSSTTYANSPAGAWYVSFGGGDVTIFVKDYPFYVRAVRGGS